MSIMIAVPQVDIEKFITGEKKFFFWTQLPYELRFYNGTNNYIFNDDCNVIYMCCNNVIKLTANIAAIYNLNFRRKNSEGIKIINARTACLEAIYKDWKSTDNSDQDIHSEDFYEYLNKIGFYNNYGILLKDVKPYSVR